MSTAPMTSDELLAQLDKWGLSYVEQDGWRERNRNHKGRWGPVHGCIQHHTGSDASDSSDISVLLNGKPGTPGPLSQFATDDRGRIHLIGWGRANHAGGGDPDVLAAVRSESYVDYPPPTHEHTDSPGAVDGNVHFYGNEATYSGAHEPTDAQYRSSCLLWAAVCDFHGWSALSLIGHKEWSDWKSDPGHVDMRDMRADVQALLDSGPPGSPTPMEDFMATMTEQEKQDILQGMRVLLVRTDFLGNTWAPRVGSILQSLGADNDAVRAGVDELQSAVEAMRDEVQRESDEMQASFAALQRNR